MSQAGHRENWYRLTCHHTGSAGITHPGMGASLDALSGGRLTLGLDVGAREDDFHAVSSTARNRGKRLEEQLATMMRIWSGQPMDSEVGPIGPPPVQPGGPEVLLGGYSSPAAQRVERWGHGFM